jgi:predicted acylesterase/phospholipase RssA
MSREFRPAPIRKPPAVRRILCIDGGGILGTFPVAFLAAIESELGRPIGGYFDLIAGTSTGGILAAALGMGLKASEVLDLYQEHGPEILGAGETTVTLTALRERGVLRWRKRSRPRADKLREVLRELLGTGRLGEARNRLVIPAWHPERERAHVYRTPHHERLQAERRTRILDVALATAATPRHLPERGGEGIGQIDGGIWANNPTALAVVEAMGPLGWDPASLRVLSLGCQAEPAPARKGAERASQAARLKDLFVDGQARGAMDMASMLTGHEDFQNRLYRIDHRVAPLDEPVDHARVLRDLGRAGAAKARDRLSHLSYVFFAQPAENFAPIQAADEE